MIWMRKAEVVTTLDGVMRLCIRAAVCELCRNLNNKN
jgi:hypothetical protein